MKQKNSHGSVDPMKDFKNFLYVIWKHLGLPPPTPIQYDIADYLQSGLKRAIVQAYRGAGKSWITSAYVLFCLRNDPNEKIMVVSASKQRADDFSTFVLKLLKEVPMLQHLHPRRDQRNSKVAFDVGPANIAHAPSVTSRGISGQLAGSRATRIIADDVEIPNNSATEDMREKLMKAVSEFEAILVPEGETQILFLGTPQTEESIYRKLHRDRHYHCCIWPARMPTNEKIADYEGMLSPYVEDSRLDEWDPVDPKRFSNQDLLEREASYGRSGFMLQFMLDTTLSDADKYPLKTSDLIVTDIGDSPPDKIGYTSDPRQQLDYPCVGLSGDRWYRPKMEEYSHLGEWTGTAMSIDVSGRGKDETGYAIVKASNGKLFLVDAGGYKGGYDEETVLVPLLKKARQHEVNYIILEDNFGQGMLEELLKPLMQKIYSCSLDSVRHNYQKERRIIDTLEPVMNQHRLVVDRKVVERDLKTHSENLVYSLFHQMTRITSERGALKHDDRLDALAIVVSWWMRVLGQDEEFMVEKRKQEALEEELQKHMDHLVGDPFGRSRTNKERLFMDMV